MGGGDEIATVSLTVGAAFVNMTMVVDYYRRGMIGDNRKVRTGDLQPASNVGTLERYRIALKLSALFQSVGATAVARRSQSTVTSRGSRDIPTVRNARRELGERDGGANAAARV